MKKIMILITAFTLSLSSVVIAQNDGMMGNNGNSNGNFSFSTTEVLLGIIVIVLIVAGLVWFFNNKRNVNSQK